MKSINEDLKNKVFRQIYLLYGEEKYLKRQYKNRLKDAMVSSDDAMNYAYFSDKGIDTNAVMELAETMPFFAEHRLIVIEDSGLFKSSNPEFADYLKQMPESTYIIFVENEIDKRGKMYKAVKEKGRVVELGHQEEHVLISWVTSLARKDEKKMPESVVRYFLTKAGTDMELLEQEMEKLLCYTVGKDEITVEDVAAVCVTQVTGHIFAMVDAVAEKKQRNALNYYYELLTLREPPMRILFMLARQFRLLLEVKELQKKGISSKEIASQVGLHPFVVKNYIAQQRAFTYDELKQIMEEAAETEQRIKTGLITDRLGVELFLVTFSAKKD